MTDVEKRAAAAKFTADWKGRGDEKQETQAFWLALFQKVYGVSEPKAYIAFEVPVKLDHTSFIDGYIASTHVLIEQKGRNVDLRKGYRQSDGSMLTPYQQARCYAGYLPHDQNPRWIVVCKPPGVSNPRYEPPQRRAGGSDAGGLGEGVSPPAIPSKHRQRAYQKGNGNLLAGRRTGRGAL